MALQLRPVRDRSGRHGRQLHLPGAPRGHDRGRGLHGLPVPLHAPEPHRADNAAAPGAPEGRRRCAASRRAVPHGVGPARGRRC